MCLEAQLFQLYTTNLGKRALASFHNNSTYVLFCSTTVEDLVHSKAWIRFCIQLLSNIKTGLKFGVKMGVTFLFIPIVLGIVLIISAHASFIFIFVRLKINHMIKKLLCFATVQQAIGFGIFVSSLVSHASGFENKLTCFLVITSIRATVNGTQASISAIAIVRYSFTDCFYRISSYSFGGNYTANSFPVMKTGFSL